METLILRELSLEDKEEVLDEEENIPEVNWKWRLKKEKKVR